MIMAMTNTSNDNDNHGISMMMTILMIIILIAIITIRRRIRADMNGCAMMIVRDEADSGSSRFVMMTKQDIKMPAREVGRGIWLHVRQFV